jgi:putative transposase
MVELVRAGRTPEELAAEFEPTAQSIRNWVVQSERNEGFRFRERSPGGVSDHHDVRAAGVSSSGYYAWIKRRPSQRAETDVVLIAEFRVAHEASRGTYGAPRIHAELAAKGLRVGRKRIARLMARAGLASVSRRRFVTTTVRNGGRQAPDLVERNFTAEACGIYSLTPAASTCSCCVHDSRGQRP